MMREPIKKIAYYGTIPLPFRWLRSASGQFFIFPFYHFVGEGHPPHVRHLYPPVSPEQFRMDLEFLLKHYRPATVHDLKEFLKGGKKSNKPLFFLSFDDGLKECFEVVCPILKSRGISAAFLINPGFVDNKALFHRFKNSLIIDRLMKASSPLLLKKIGGLLGNSGSGLPEYIKRIQHLKQEDNGIRDQVARLLDLRFEAFLEKEKPYLTLEQLKKMESEGFLIGGHSMNHPLFSELEKHERIEQIAGSMRFIEEHFSPELNAFAFPFTDAGVPGSVFRYIEGSEKIDLSLGTAGLKRDCSPKHIQRIPMDDLHFRGSEKILRTEYAYFLLKSLFGRNSLHH